MRATRSWLELAASFVVAHALVTFMVAATPAQAQDYPNKPVTIITPAAAGNSPDVVTRLIADRLTQIWKQQVIILNRPGAGGLIAAQAAAGVEKDGYTLYMAQASTYTVLPVQQEKMPVDLDKAFTPIGLAGVQPIGVAVNPTIGVNTLPELIAKIKSTPGGLLFGATNRGGQSHLTGELFRARENLEMTFVHAQGASTTLNDIIAGRIPIMFEGLAGLAPGLQGGQIKAIGVASEKRLPNLPDLPTIAETVPGFQSAGWLALMAPTGTPPAIIQKINADLRAVQMIPDVIQRFEVLGTYPRNVSPEETAAFIQAEQKLWWPIVRQVAK